MSQGQPSSRTQYAQHLPFSKGSVLKSETTLKDFTMPFEMSSGSCKMPALRGGGRRAEISDRLRSAYSALLSAPAAELVRDAGDIAERRPPPSCSFVPCSSAPPGGKAISSYPPWRLLRPPLGVGDAAESLLIRGIMLRTMLRIGNSLWASGSRVSLIRSAAMHSKTVGDTCEWPKISPFRRGFGDGELPCCQAALSRSSPRIPAEE